MNRTPRISTAVLLALLGATGARASNTPAAPQLRQMDAVIYQMPFQWNYSDRNGYACCAQWDVRKPMCSFLIGRTETLNGSAEAWLTTKMHAVLASGEQAGFNKPPKRSKLGDHDVVIAAQQVGRYLQIHVGLMNRDKIVHIWFKTPGDQPGAQAVTDVFMPVLATVKFIGPGVPPLVGPAQPGSLEGVFWGTETSMGLDGMQMNSITWMFTRSGHFYQGVPAGRAPRTIDFADAMSRESSRCGNYVLNGSNMELTFGNGFHQFCTIQHNGSALTLGRLQLFLQSPIPDGARMDGCWSAANYRAFSPGGGVEGGVGSTHSLTLRPDGTFQSAGFGFGNATFVNSSGDVTGGYTARHTPANVTGHYDFKDGVLVLTALDGSRSTKNVMMVGQRLMMIDGVSHTDRSKPEIQTASHGSR